MYERRSSDVSFAPSTVDKTLVPVAAQKYYDNSVLCGTDRPINALIDLAGSEPVARATSRKYVEVCASKAPLLFDLRCAKDVIASSRLQKTTDPPTRRRGRKLWATTLSNTSR